MTTSPLQPPPHWSHTPGAGWHDASALVTSSHVGDPASFVHGYEQGAYALAAELNHRIKEGAMLDAMVLLASYRNGAAHPVAGWEHEPKRN